MEDFGLLWEGLVLRGTAVSIHRDGNMCRERGRDLVPDQISVSPRGWRPAVINVAAFLPITEGQVA